MPSWVEHEQSFITLGPDTTKKILQECIAEVWVSKYIQ